MSDAPQILVHDRWMHTAVPQPGTIRMCDPGNLKQVREDKRLVKAGILDEASFRAGYSYQIDPVELVVRDGDALRDMGLYAQLAKCGFELGVHDPTLLSENADYLMRKLGKHAERIPAIMRQKKWNRAVRALRRQHNSRTVNGRDFWQRPHMFGDTAFVSIGSQMFGTATATSATSLTNTGASFPASGGASGNGLAGHIVYCPAAGVYGVIINNTSTILTVAYWVDATSSTGAAGTTPASTAIYQISPSMGGCKHIGLSTDTTTVPTPDTDVLRSADGLFSTGASTGTATELTTGSYPGLGRVLVPPSFPSASNIQAQQTFTYGGGSSVTINKAIYVNSGVPVSPSSPNPGTLLIFDSLLNAPAALYVSGDNTTITWAVSI